VDVVGCRFVLVAMAYVVYVVFIGSRALSFKRPLLSLSVEFCGFVCLCVCVFVGLSANLRSNISKTKGARAKVTMGS